MARPRRAISGAALEAPEQHFTVLQIAGAHGFSPAAVVGFIRNGELRGRKFGKEWRVAVSDYRAWLQAATVNPLEVSA